MQGIEIAKQAKMQNIEKIAKKLWIKNKELELYWNYKAKISLDIFKRLENKKDWKLILVTAINPTPAWEWKTTTTVWIWQALKKLWKNWLICLREPSLWPVMWLKWWATGWWYAQVVPMEDINMHFTWDIHAITSAHLLISAAIDNHIFQWNTLQIDTQNIVWKRAIDVNDRALRNINYSPDWKAKNEIKSWFIITTASELMAILCLSNDIADLKNRIWNIIFWYDINWNPLKLVDLKIVWSIVLLLKDAIKPNLVQTLENSPCIIHGWPFANIAHGCSSIIATKLALKLSDFVVTEAGFWSDLWAEKFFNIKCDSWSFKPDLVVLVATIRSLKYNWGQDLKELSIKNLETLEKWFPNLEKHIENMKKFGMNLVVCLNVFNTDTIEEIEFVKNKCLSLWVKVELWYWFSKWWDWMKSLTKTILQEIKNDKSNFTKLYNNNDTVINKIKSIVYEIYGGKNIILSDKASNSLEKIVSMWYDKLPICMAKTPVSLSDNPKLLARPKDFDFHIEDIQISSGAWFLIVISWSVMRMPGLPKTPNYENMDIADSWEILWLS